MKMRSKALQSLLFLASASALIGCGGVEDSSEFKELSNEVAVLSDEVGSLKSSIESALSSIEEQEVSQTNQLAALKQQRLDLMNEFAGLLDEIGIGKVISKFGVPACKREAFETEKMTGSTDKLDVDFWEAVWAELTPAENIFSLRRSYDEYPATVNEYATQLGKTSCSKDGSNDFYDGSCKKVDRLQLKKNPDKFKGQCITGSVKIAQLDANTGPCSFQGYLSGDYDVRAQFGTTLDTSTHSSTTDCEWTDNLVEDKYIEFWGWGLGSYSYSTTSGGTQTVPAFKLVAWR
jgi:hypothetical protein